MATRHDYDPKALLAAKRRATKAAPTDKRKGSGLTPRVQKAIEVLVHGLEDDNQACLTFEDAAKHAGITARALRAAMLKPAVDGFYQREMISLRNGARAASIRAIIGIRDDKSLVSPAGKKVVLEAAKVLAFDPPGSTIGVNVHVGVKVETAGYVIDLSGDDDDRHVIDHRAPHAPWSPTGASK